MMRTLLFILLLMIPTGGWTATVSVTTRPAAKQEKKETNKESDLARSIDLGGYVGFSERSGQVRPGRFAPVRVELKTRGAPFDGELIIRSVKRTEGFAYEPLLVFPVKVGINTSKAFSDIFMIDPKTDSLVAELWVKGKKIKESHLGLAQIPEHRFAVLVLTEQEGTLNRIAQSDYPLPARRRTVVYGRTQALPLHRFGYESMDAVLIDNVSLNDVDEAQANALKTWVQSGGSLIIGGGAGWQRIDQSFLSDWLPMKLEGSKPIDSPFPPPSKLSAASAPTRIMVVETKPNDSAREAEVLWADQSKDVPLIVRSRFGAGTITFLAFSLADKEVNSSPLLADVCQTLFMGRKEIGPIDLRPDRAVQVDTVLKQKTLLPLPSPETVAYWMLAYLGLFLPLLFVAAWAWRGPALAWIMLPVGFLLATIVLLKSGRTESGGQRSFIQLSVCQHSAYGGIGQGSAYLSLYTEPADQIHVLSWLPQNLLWPLPTLGMASGKPEPFHYDNLLNQVAELREFHLPPRSAQSFQINFAPESDAPEKESFAEFSRTSTMQEENSKWVTTAEFVRGQITNNTGLHLRDAAILGMGRALPQGEVKPGQTIEFQLRPTAGQGIDQWAQSAITPSIARETNAVLDLATGGKGTLAPMLGPYEVALAGWTPVNPIRYEARSQKALQTILSNRSTNATWHLIKTSAPAAGELLHLEMADFEITSWNPRETTFSWAKREDYLADMSIFEPNETWVIQVKPRMALKSQTQPRWPVANAFGSIIDNGPGQMELFDFTTRAWVKAPEPNQGRRIIPPAATGLRAQALPLSGDRVVDRATGEIWIRLTGQIFDLTQAQLEVKMNYSLWK